MEPDARTRSAALPCRCRPCRPFALPLATTPMQIAAVALQPGKYGSTKVHAENAENAEKGVALFLRVSA